MAISDKHSTMSRKETSHQMTRCSPSPPAVVKAVVVLMDVVEELAPALSIPWDLNERRDRFPAHIRP